MIRPTPTVQAEQGLGAAERLLIDVARNPFVAESQRLDGVVPLGKRRRVKVVGLAWIPDAVERDGVLEVGGEDEPRDSLALVPETVDGTLELGEVGGVEVVGARFEGAIEWNGFAAHIFAAGDNLMMDRDEFRARQSFLRVTDLRLNLRSGARRDHSSECEEGGGKSESELHDAGGLILLLLLRTIRWNMVAFIHPVFV